MKKILGFFLLVAILTACDKGGWSSNSSLTFRKADISGSSMLALASSAPATKAEGDYSSKPILWKVSPDGSMVEVTYVVEVEGASGEIANTFRQEARLTMENILPIGNDWLWLMNASVYCPGVDLGRYGIDTFPFNYLLRRRDGALFRLWNESKGDTNFSLQFEEGIASRFQKSDIAQFISCQNGTIYSSLGFISSLYIDVNFQPKWPGWSLYTRPVLYEESSNMVKLLDNGTTLDMVSLLPTNIGAYNCLVTNSGLIGSSVWYLNSNSYAHILVNPSSSNNAITLIQTPPSVDVKNTSLILIGGELYLIVYNDNNVQLKKVAADGSTSDVIYHENSIEFFFPRVIVYSGTSASWVAQGKMFIFDTKAKTYSVKQLPAHYPYEGRDYYNGVAYVVEQSSSIPSSYYKCDLSADAAQEVHISWSAEAQSYGPQTIPGGGSYRFINSSMTMIRSASLVDGRSITYYINLQNNTGTCMVSGSNVSGQVVTTLVRLN